MHLTATHLMEDKSEVVQRSARTNLLDGSDQT